MGLRGDVVYRTAIEQLYRWKEKNNRKPLIIRGARQVGKTWLMKEFGAKAYENCVYINFDNNRRMQNLFDGNMDIERIINGLDSMLGIKLISQIPC